MPARLRPALLPAHSLIFVERHREAQLLPCTACIHFVQGNGALPRLHVRALLRSVMRERLNLQPLEDRLEVEGPAVTFGFGRVDVGMQRANSAPQSGGHLQHVATTRPSARNAASRV